MSLAIRVRNSLAVATAVSCTVLGGAMLMTATSASHADPPGNNGTVKIAPDGEFDSIPQNHPHQGCTFQVEWYNFDSGGITSTVTFAMQAPTKDVVLGGTEPSQVVLEDDPNGGADPDPDGVQVYTLTFDGDPHPVQGYHVKLTINTPGSIGSDKKHKVFWVEGCGTETSTTPTETTPTETTPTETSPSETETSPSDTTVSPSEATSTPPEETEATTPPAPTDDVSVQGEQAAVPASVDAGLAGTEPAVPGGTATLGALGLLVAALGAGLIGASVVARKKV